MGEADDEVIGLETMLGSILLSVAIGDQSSIFLTEVHKSNVGRDGTVPLGPRPYYYSCAGRGEGPFQR